MPSQEPQPRPRKTLLSCDYPYSFEEFQSQSEAISQVSSPQFFDLSAPPSGPLNPKIDNTARIGKYFSEHYPDGREANQKTVMFIAIHGYASLHYWRLRLHGLVKRIGDERKLFVSQGVLRAVHFAMTKLGADAGFGTGKIVKLAKAFNALYPGV